MAMLAEGRIHGGEGTLPQDHEDQMQLGIRIITSAHTSKVHALEQEIKALRLTCDEQRGTLANMQKKSSSLEVELVESHQRSQQLAEENKELFRTVGSLRKQLGRLEGLKSAIISTVQEDDEKSAAFGDVKALMSEDYIQSATPLTANYAVGGALRSQAVPASAGIPGGPFTSQQAAVIRANQQHPQMGSGFSPGSPGASASGPSSGEIDGKAFFRQARGKLSYEAFNQFLQSIKRLNSQQQTREETLSEAQRIFGPQLQDLYMDFENLLNRPGLAGQGF